jgi:hypothetical protein
MVFNATFNNISAGGGQIYWWGKLKYPEKITDLPKSLTEELEDAKGVIRICKSKKDRQHNGQKIKEKQRSTKHYTEN